MWDFSECVIVIVIEGQRQNVPGRTESDKESTCRRAHSGCGDSERVASVRQRTRHSFFYSEDIRRIHAHIDDTDRRISMQGR